MDRHQFTPEYKAKIVLEILKEEQSIGEIASRKNINRTQLQNWKKEFLQNASRVFAQSKNEREAQQIVKEATERVSPVSKGEKLTVKPQCELLEINCTSVYYESSKLSTEQIERKEQIKAMLDYWHTKMVNLGVSGL